MSENGQAIAVDARKRTEEERCGKCGTMLFKLYKDRGCIFVEVKCKECGKPVIRKFKEE